MVTEQPDVVINDARRLDQSRRRQIEVHGFELLQRNLQRPDIKFLDNRQVVQEYYPECAEIVRKATNAAQAFAFDHNIRWAAGKDSRRRITGGQQVHRPIHVVHGDYTLLSAPQRLRDLANPPGVNDTLRSVLAEGESLLTTDALACRYPDGLRPASRDEQLQYKALREFTHHDKHSRREGWPNPEVCTLIPVGIAVMWENQHLIFRTVSVRFGTRFPEKPVFRADTA